MFLLPEAIYRFNIISIEIPLTSLTKIEKKIPTFIWNLKGLQRAKAFLRKKNSAVVITLPDSNLHYNTTVIKQYGSGIMFYLVLE